MDSYIVMIDRDNSMIISAAFIEVKDGMVLFKDEHKFVTSAFTIANIKGYWKVLPGDESPQLEIFSKIGRVDQRI